MEICVDRDIQIALLSPQKVLSTVGGLRTEIGRAGECVKIIENVQLSVRELKQLTSRKEDRNCVPLHQQKKPEGSNIRKMKFVVFEEVKDAA